ncbi:MAG: hypothetical protein PVF28_04555 [Thioalkalispiraceae bacterium]|jgi:hypothetical protein
MNRQKPSIFFQLLLLSLFGGLLFACSDADEGQVSTQIIAKKKGSPLTIPASNGVILACSQKQNGQLRIVNDHSECHPSEDPVSWNTSGPAGPQGPAGQCAACMPEKFQLVGFSNQSAPGNTGVLQLTTLCQASFPNSRICTTEEVARSVSFPAVTSSPANPGPSAWVAPTTVAGRGATVGFDVITGIQKEAEGLSCGGWAGTYGGGGSGGGTGLTVNDRGQFKLNPCSTSMKVACCARVPQTN